MKKQNLFKGKCIDDDKWVCSFYFGDKPFNNLSYIGFTWDTKYYVRTETVCMFTGIVDIQDHKVFEDDLRITDDGKTIFRIYRINGGFVIKDSVWMKNIQDLKFGDDLIFAHLTDAQTKSWLMSGTKHYGNIYDNSNLIGK